jgi:zinc protease
MKLAIIRKFLIIVIGLCFAFPASAKLFDAQEFELSNKMRIIVAQNHKAPIVTSMIWYKVGSIDDFAGRTGLAHFNEHLMFKGTHMVPEGEFSKIIARNGGVDNAFTSYDFTSYHQTIAKDKLELLMLLEADRMKDILLSDKAFEKEHKVIVEERLSRYENNPKALFGEKMNGILWGKNPYGKPVIGFMDEIKAISKDDVLRFHKKWYAPNNAILVVAGDVDPTEVKNLAEKYFGHIPAVDLPARGDVNIEPLDINARISMRHEQVKQPFLKRSYIAPSIMVDSERMSFAIDVLSEILGGSTTSRLYRSLVIKQKIAVSAGSWYNANNLGKGTFSIYASPSENVDLADLEKAVDDEIEKLMREKITTQELEKAKKRLWYGLAYLRDNTETIAEILGRYAVIGYPIKELETWDEKIKSVTLEDVMKAANHLFLNAVHITGTLSPKGKR